MKVVGHAAGIHGGGDFSLREKQSSIAEEDGEVEEENNSLAVHGTLGLLREFGKVSFKFGQITACSMTWSLGVILM